MMTEAEIERALDSAYAAADKAFVAINGTALETRSIDIAALAETIRQARDAIGRFNVPDMSRQAKLSDNPADELWDVEISHN